MTRFSLLLLSFTLALVFVAPAVPAHAQKPRGKAICGEHDTLLDVLQRRHGEKRVAIGVINDGTILEVLATPSGSTWFAVLTSTSGSSCLVAFGSDLSMRAVPATVSDGPDM